MMTAIIIMTMGTAITTTMTMIMGTMAMAMIMMPITITTTGTTAMRTAMALVTPMTEPLPAFDMAGRVVEDWLAVPALQRLLAWLSPAFPVGAYSYSHGLEWAIEDGTVTTPASLQAWIADVLHHGGGRSDAILFAAAWRAAVAGDHAGLAEVGELAAALQPSRERHLETTAQGRAFLDTVAATWPGGRLSAMAALFPAGTPIAYPVAVAVAAAAAEVPLRPALAAFAGAFVANLVSAGVRAIPIGQTDGQRIIAALAPAVADVARLAEAATLDDLGGAALRADMASMKHETQYTRLFRS
jgi:urease accessory protein